MRVALNGTIALAVADYIGGAVIECDVVPDPQIAGVYAIQALVKPEDGNALVVQFLLRGVPLQNVVAGDLEEVEFVMWPPTTR